MLEGKPRGWGYDQERKANGGQSPEPPARGLGGGFFHVVPEAGDMTKNVRPWGQSLELRGTSAPVSR